MSENASSGLGKIETTLLNRRGNPRVICAEFNVQYYESCDSVAYDVKCGATHLPSLLSR